MYFQNKVLTLDQAAEYLGYKKAYIYQLTSAGVLPFHKPNGKKMFFEREKLEEWMLGNSGKSDTERQTEAAKGKKNPMREKEMCNG